MPKNHPPLTAERLRELLSYDPETGIMKRLVSRPHSPVGANVGCLNSSGYLQAAVDGKIYMVHRLAWLHSTGEWPKEELDHINGVRTDNSKRNLREATREENRQNLKRYKSNTSGHPGVTWNAASEQWLAEVWVRKKRIRVGLFDKFDSAVAARVAAKKKAHEFQPTERL